MGVRVFAIYLHEMILKEYIDIKDINPIGILNISHKNWHLAKVGNYLTWEPKPMPIQTAITEMSIKEIPARTEISKIILLPGKIHKINIDAKFS